MKFYNYVSFLLRKNIYNKSLDSENVIWYNDDFIIIDKNHDNFPIEKILSYVFIGESDRKYIIAKEFANDFIIIDYIFETENMISLFNKYFKHINMDSINSIILHINNFKNYILESEIVEDFIITGKSNEKNYIILKNNIVSMSKRLKIDVDIDMIDKYHYINSIYGVFMKSILTNI